MIKVTKAITAAMRSKIANKILDSTSGDTKNKVRDFAKELQDRYNKIPNDILNPQYPRILVTEKVKNFLEAAYKIHDNNSSYQER